MEEASQPLYAKWRDEDPPISTTILASPGQVELHLTLRDSDAGRAQARLARAQDDLHRALGADVFSTDGRSMEEIVGEQLVARGYRIAAAESCTGGLLMARLTDVPGSSRYVHAAVVSYDNEAKTDLLNVPAALIAQHGAVSEPVAVAMAEGVRALTGADVAVAITGVAGPGGGTPAKPVGTVVIAVLVPGATGVRSYVLVRRRTHDDPDPGDAGRHGSGTPHDLGVRTPCACSWPPSSRTTCAVRSPQEATICGAVSAAVSPRDGFPPRVSTSPFDSSETCPTTRRAELIRAISAPLHLSPFEIRLGDCGIFPPSGPPRVIWMALADGSAGARGSSIAR